MSDCNRFDDHARAVPHGCNGLTPRPVLTLRDEAEYDHVGRLLEKIDEIARDTPSWLWDWSNLADLNDRLDRSQLSFEITREDRS